MTSLDVTLDHLATLPENWNSYGAKPITAAAIDAVRAISIIPTVDGGIALEWHRLGEDVEIEFDSMGRTVAVSWESRRA